MEFKKIKKLFALIVSACLSVAIMPLGVWATVSQDNIDTLLSGVSFTYTFKDTSAGSAKGLITFDFGELPQENITSIKYYWVDSSGKKLSGYKQIVEFSDAYTSPYAKSNNVNALSNASVGYAFTNGSVIPFGACGIVAELAITVGENTVTKTVTKGNYVTTVGGVQTDNTVLPDYKLAITDYTTDVGGEELYQLMYFADFHNYYEWKAPGDDTYNFKNISEKYNYITSDAKIGSPQGKAMFAVNKILDLDAKSIGTVNVGDIIDAHSGGTGMNQKNTIDMVERGDYNAVLATYYQAGLMDYFNFFAVGNHDLIAHYADSDRNQFIEILGLALAENKALAESYTAVTGLPQNADSYYYDYYIGADHYIVLSAPHESPSALGEAQLLWFENLLKADDAAGVRTFVACHESLTGTGVVALSEYLADEAELKKILNENSANHKVYFFTGHTHVSYLDNIQNVYISEIGNVSYIGLPYICDTALKDISQGLQVKVYEDKVVFLGRQLYENKAYCTDMLPSAMYVAFENEDAVEIPSLIEISNSYELSQIGIDPAKPLSGNYILTSDIDLSAYENWTPIGYYMGAVNVNGVTTQFTGKFDGNGHTISNMYCLTDSGKYRFAGLFGSLKDATVKNLCLKNCAAYVYNGNLTSAAGMLAGGVVSTDSAPYSTVISNVSVLGGWVKCAKANASNPGAAGGLVGFSQSGVNIFNCYVDTDVIAVLNLSTDAQSKQLGVGGLVGMAYDAKLNASNCMFVGSLDASKYYGTECTAPIATDRRQNAVLGFNNRDISNTKYDNTNNAVITNCYYLDGVVVNAGNPRGADGTSKTLEELSLCDISDLGLSEELWLHNGFMPVLKCSGDREYVKGDIDNNGTVNILDLVRFKKYKAGVDVVAALKAVDLNSTKAIETEDLVLLQQQLLSDN